MVDVITKKCAAPGGCPKQPSFGVAGSRKAEYCARHSSPGMICLRTSKAKKDYAGGKRRADDGSDMDDMDGRRTRRKSSGGTGSVAPMDWSALQSAAAAAYISKMVPLPTVQPPPTPPIQQQQQMQQPQPQGAPAASPMLAQAQLPPPPQAQAASPQPPAQVPSTQAPLQVQYIGWMLVGCATWHRFSISVC